MSNLPNWDLSDLYSGINDPKISEHLDNAQSLSNNLERKYKGKIASLSGDEIADLILEYQDISTKLGPRNNFCLFKFCNRYA